MDSVILINKVKQYNSLKDIVLIQRWWRKLLSLVPCQDCHTWRTKDSLLKVPSCPDFQISFNYCCTKNVCKDGCVVHCSNWHCNISYDDDGWRTSLECRICKERIHPSFDWIGLDLKTARDRYW